MVTRLRSDPVVVDVGTVVHWLVVRSVKPPTMAADAKTPRDGGRHLVVQAVNH